jgi:3-isopropylmalate dehydratase small subunit
MAFIESSPASIMSVDLEHERVTAEGRSWPTTMPSHARDAMITGQWDGAGLLLERYDEVADVERRLPY